MIYEVWATDYHDGPETTDTLVGSYRKSWRANLKLIWATLVEPRSDRSFYRVDAEDRDVL